MPCEIQHTNNLWAQQIISVSIKLASHTRPTMPEFTHLNPNFTQKCVVNASYSHAATEWLRNIYQGSPIMVRGG